MVVGDCHQDHLTRKRQGNFLSDTARDVLRRPSPESILCVPPPDVTTLCTAPSTAPLLQDTVCPDVSVVISLLCNVHVLTTLA